MRVPMSKAWPGDRRHDAECLHYRSWGTEHGPPARGSIAGGHDVSAKYTRLSATMSLDEFEENQGTLDRGNTPCIAPFTLEEAPYYAARKDGYTVPRAASFAGKALALAKDVTQGLGPPHGPHREGRAAAPRRALPRTVRSRWRVAYFSHRTVEESGALANGETRRSLPRRYPCPPLSPKVPPCSLPRHPLRPSWASFAATSEARGEL